MVATLLSVVLLNPPKAPKWLDTNLAGYALAWNEKHQPGCFHDAKKGFYVMRTVDCDGAHQSLVLTRDRKMVAGYSFHVKGLPKSMGENGYAKVQDATFKNLSTSKGVRIGDSQTSVRAKLGAPSKQEKAGDQKQFLEWRYLWRNVHKGVGDAWENTYVFKAGKLIEVRFNKDAVPGCGE